jgi:hypothetical protein
MDGSPAAAVCRFMRRLSFLTLFLLAITRPASAHFAVSPSNLSVAIGTTAAAYAYWDHGLTMYGDRDDFASDDPTIALASGTVLKGSLSGAIPVIGIRSGIAHIVNTATHEVLSTITVFQPPARNALATPSSQIVIPVRTPVELRVIPEGWSATNCAWFYGEVGDTSAPADVRTGTEFSHTFYATQSGVTRIWARAASQDGIASVQFTVRAVPSLTRRRSARH